MKIKIHLKVPKGMEEHFNKNRESIRHGIENIAQIDFERLFKKKENTK